MNDLLKYGCLVGLHMNMDWQNVKEITMKANELQIEYWINENLFTFSWWVLFVTTFLSLVIWIILVDKKRIFEIITFGIIINVIAINLDKIGVLKGIWAYKITLTPSSTMLAVHIVMMPIIYMLIYQYFNTWKSFVMAMTITAFIFAFVLEPILVWLDIYELIHWKHYYSFLPYILIALFCRYIMQTIKQKYG